MRAAGISLNCNLSLFGYLGLTSPNYPRLTRPKRSPCDVSSSSPPVRSPRVDGFLAHQGWPWWGRNDGHCDLTNSQNVWKNEPEMVVWLRCMGIQNDLQYFMDKLTYNDSAYSMIYSRNIEPSMVRWTDGSRYGIEDSKHGQFHRQKLWIPKVLGALNFSQLGYLFEISGI